MDRRGFLAALVVVPFSAAAARAGAGPMALSARARTIAAPLALEAAGEASVPLGALASAVCIGSDITADRVEFEIVDWAHTGNLDEITT